LGEHDFGGGGGISADYCGGRVPDKLSLYLSDKIF